MTNAGIVDLVIDQGADWAAQFYWADHYGVPFNVVPPIRMQVRDNLNQVVLERVHDPDLGEGMVQNILYNGATGLIQVIVSADESNAIPPGIYSYDLFSSFIDPSPNAEEQRKAKIMAGKFIVEGRVTRGE